MPNMLSGACLTEDPPYLHPSAVLLPTRVCFSFRGFWGGYWVLRVSGALARGAHLHVLLQHDVERGEQAALRVRNPCELRLRALRCNYRVMNRRAPAHPAAAQR